MKGFDGLAFTRRGRGDGVGVRMGKMGVLGVVRLMLWCERGRGTSGRRHASHEAWELKSLPRPWGCRVLVHPSHEARKLKQHLWRYQPIKNHIKKLYKNHAKPAKKPSTPCTSPEDQPEPPPLRNHATASSSSSSRLHLASISLPHTEAPVFPRSRILPIPIPQKHGQAHLSHGPQKSETTNAPP